MIPLPACHHNHNNNPVSDNDHDNEGIKSTPDTTLCLRKEKATLQLVYRNTNKTWRVTGKNGKKKM